MEAKMKKVEEDVMVVDDQNNKLNKVSHGIFLQDGYIGYLSTHQYKDTRNTRKRIRRCQVSYTCVRQRVFHFDDCRCLATLSKYTIWTKLQATYADWSYPCCLHF